MSGKAERFGEIAFTGVKQEYADDCVRACVASLFGLGIESVPRFTPEDWGQELDAWLGARGYAFINVRYTGEQKDSIPRGYTIGAIPTISTELPPDWMHSVICLDGKVIWDPILGEQPGIERAVEYTIVYRLIEHCHKAKQRAALDQIESLIHEAYQLAGWITARVPGKEATEEQEIRLLDILAYDLPDRLSGLSLEGSRVQDAEETTVSGMSVVGEG